MRCPLAMSALMVLPALLPTYGQSAQSLGNPDWGQALSAVSDDRKPVAGWNV